MFEPWKKLALLPPPVQTTQINGYFDTQGLKHACNNIVRVLSKQSPLHRESALLSRFLYKYDKKFRNDIGYRNIRKTNSTMRKYLQVNLMKDVENFIAILPNKDDYYLPSRQMLEYVLLRIITFSKLMLRVYVCSKQAAIFYLNRVKRGESHWMSLMPYALLSRIWSICSVLLQHATSWYFWLYPYLSKLCPKGLQFLPANYELPENLEEWLDLKNLDTFGKLEWSQRKSMKFGIAFLEDEEGDTFDTIFEYANNINEEKEPEVKIMLLTQKLTDYEQLQVANIAKVDHGQAISRDSFDILTNFQKKINNQTKSIHYFGRVTNIKSLKEFLDKEEILRNDRDNQSLTIHLSFMQWMTLKSALLKVCNSISNMKNVERKLQKVWQDKCLDYL